MKVLVIMGAGFIGQQVWDNILPRIQNQYDEIYFFDNNKAKQGTCKGDALILGESELLEKVNAEDVNIILATDQWQQLYKQCMEWNVDTRIISIYNKFNFNSYLIYCYSQDGEEFYLKSKYGITPDSEGYYVDIGAHHPFRFSNTFWAYSRGWNGINIEPDEIGYNALVKNRARDINLRCGVGEKEGVLNYYRFDESAFNTFSAEDFEGKRRPKEVVQVPVYRLETIFEEHKVSKIDFMNIDVEGMELSVLRSNDWNRWKPRYILIEQKNMNIEDILHSDIYILLKQYGYVCDYKSLRTAIYRLCE